MFCVLGVVLQTILDVYNCFTCIVSLYRNDPTPRKNDHWLVFQTLYIYIYIYSCIYKLILESHVILYVFWLVKKLSTFSYVLNLKIDNVPKASHAVVIRRFSLNEAPLGLFKFISDYLPYFEKINLFFNIIAKKAWINL